MGEPAIEGAIHERVADKEKENQGEQGHGHGPEDHLGFEARAKLVGAPLHPEVHQRAAKDESEDHERGNDEGGKRVEDNDFVPSAKLKREAERPEGEYRGQQQDQE